MLWRRRGWWGLSPPNWSGFSLKPEGHWWLQHPCTAREKRGDKGHGPALPEAGWAGITMGLSPLSQQLPSSVPVCFLELQPLPSIQMGKLRHRGSSGTQRPQIL